MRKKRLLTGLDKTVEVTTDILKIRVFIQNLTPDPEEDQPVPPAGYDRHPLASCNGCFSSSN